MAVDFREVMRNAAKDGTNLQEIAIKYENLTADEIEVLESRQLITHRLPGGSLLAKFPIEGEPPFPDKATGFFHLGT